MSNQELTDQQRADAKLISDAMWRAYKEQGAGKELIVHCAALAAVFAEFLRQAAPTDPTERAQLLDAILTTTVQETTTFDSLQ